MAGQSGTSGEIVRRIVIALATLLALVSLPVLIQSETTSVREWATDADSVVNWLLWLASGAGSGGLLVLGLLGESRKRLHFAALFFVPALLAFAAFAVVAGLADIALTPLLPPVLAWLWARELGNPAKAGAAPKDRVATLIQAQRHNAAFAELRSQPLNGQTVRYAGQLMAAYEAAQSPEQADHVRRYLCRELANAAPRIAQTTKRDAAIPQSLGRYDLEGVLGKGAMGSVYLARDARINRSVALKVVNLEREFDASGLDAARARFFQEAESAGRLHHPDIVLVYDASEVDGRAYIAMEYVCGAPLADFVSRERALPVGQVLELIARAADALGYAHEHNVIHRDIKPANLMFDEATDQLKIMDFGVAQLNDTVRTRTGLILGTPAYMSPEQLQGLTLSGHSDLFSLGVTLYELLIGEVPFKAQSVVEIARMVSTAKVVPASSLRTDLPASIDEVLSRALAKTPSERYANGWEMASALRQVATELDMNSTRRIAAK